MFQPGFTYTKNDIYRLLAVPPEIQRGAWDTGLRFYDNDAFVFANVEIAGRTGHNYGNHWDGDELIWFGLTDSHTSQPTIQKLLNPSGRILIFTRTVDRAPFYYEGEGTALHCLGERPVCIVWGLKGLPTKYPDEVAITYGLSEGAAKSVLVNRFERNIAARRACLAHYGDLGKGFIHVHHLVPLASIGHEYILDPVHDLRPVCPNCHAMLHRTTPPLSIDTLQQQIRL
jgi:5-methylcytosine-specific restriction protein A